MSHDEGSNPKFTAGTQLWVKGIVNNFGDILFGNGDVIGCDDFEDLIITEELNTPSIPQYMADWIEIYKLNSLTVYLAYNIAISSKGIVHDWVFTHSETFAKAWLNGYTIIKDKLYTVEIPDPNNHFWKVTKLEKREDGSVRIGHSDDDNWKHKVHNQLTETEIKKDFEWAWQWAEEVKEL